MENQFSQEKLDKFIRFNLDEMVLFQKLSGRKSSFDKTELNTDLDKLNYPNVVFKYSVLDRIVVLFISLVIVFIGFVFYFENKSIVPIAVSIAIAFVVNLSYWFKAEKNILELSSNGVTYNSTNYPWNEIEKTMIWSKAILNRRRGYHREFIYYLVLALKNGEIETIEISSLNLNNEKGTEISRFLLREHQLVSHFVEYFKQKTVTTEIENL